MQMQRTSFSKLLDFLFRKFVGRFDVDSKENKIIAKLVSSRELEEDG